MRIMNRIAKRSARRLSMQKGGYIHLAAPAPLATDEREKLRRMLRPLRTKAPPGREGPPRHLRKNHWEN